MKPPPTGHPSNSGKKKRVLGYYDGHDQRPPGRQRSRGRRWHRRVMQRRLRRWLREGLGW